MAFSQTPNRQLSDSEWAEGYNGFALICRSLGLEPQTNTVWQRDLEPSESIIVVLGAYRSSNRQNASLSRFIRRGGAVLFASDTETVGYFFSRYLRIECPRGYLQTNDPQDQFNGFADCPVVTEFPADHPVTRGLQTVMTNRTGGLSLEGSNWQAIATLPPMSNRNNIYHFLAVPKNLDSRVVVCADPSVFSNQMVFQGDNARLALQAMHWLKQGKRTELVILNYGREISPEDPQVIDVDFPAPSPEDVWDAIQKLPPDLLLGFGNEIAALVEDENLVNELMSEALNDVEDFYIIRFLIFTATFLLAGFVFFRYMSSESTLQDVVGVDTFTGTKWRAERSQGSRDRLKVAQVLVASFYETISAGCREGFADFPENIKLVNCGNPAEIKRDMRKTRKLLRPLRHRKWRPSRLEQLQVDLDAWKHLYDQGQLIYSLNQDKVTSANTHQREAEANDNTN
ncbi:MAG: hypothetical protein P8M80_19090 [Pirellulaceae bacterium]|nr:hypothetical protein [Pirellulaceae bacterium]